MLDLPGAGTEHMSPTLPGGFFTTEPPEKPHIWSLSLTWEWPHPLTEWIHQNRPFVFHNHTVAGFFFLYFFFLLQKHCMFTTENFEPIGKQKETKTSCIHPYVYHPFLACRVHHCLFFCACPHDHFPKPTHAGFSFPWVQEQEHFLFFKSSL